jgi:hypothetical protein
MCVSRPMAHVACSKKQRARTSLTRSPTKPPSTTSTSHTTVKEKMHKLDDTWNKCRPYLERVNGTIVPLRSQSVDEQREEERVVLQRKLERKQTL